MCICICICICMCMCMYVCMYTCNIYIYIYMYMYVYVYGCIFRPQQAGFLGSRYCLSLFRLNYVRVLGSWDYWPQIRAASTVFSEFLSLWLRFTKRKSGNPKVELHLKSLGSGHSGEEQSLTELSSGFRAYAQAPEPSYRTLAEPFLPRIPTPFRNCSPFNQVAHKP